MNNHIIRKMMNFEINHVNQFHSKSNNFAVQLSPVKSEGELLLKLRILLLLRKYLFHTRRHNYC